MKIAFKLIGGYSRRNIKQTVITLLSVILAIAVITAVCGIVSSVMFFGESEADANTDKSEIALMYSLAWCMVLITAATASAMIYSAFSVSYRKRIKMFGFLLSIGMSKTDLIAIVFTEAVIYAVSGCIFGIVIGNLGGKFFYKVCIEIMYTMSNASITEYIFTPNWFIVAIVLGVVATVGASVVPMYRINNITVLGSIYGRTKINVSLRESWSERLFEKLFGRLGKLAAQNYENNRGRYRSLSLSLAGGTAMYFFVYCFFMYHNINYAQRGWDYDIVANAIGNAALAFVGTFIFVALICSMGSISANMDERRREFAMLKSIGLQNSQLNKIISIEGIVIVLYSLIYGVIGSVAVDYFILWVYRTQNMSEREILLFKYPVEIMAAFVVLYIAVAFLFSLFFVGKVKHISIVDSMKAER